MESAQPATILQHENGHCVRIKCCEHLGSAIDAALQNQSMYLPYNLIKIIQKS